MSFTHTHEEWIQKFLDRQLDGEELDAFQQLYEQDPAFAEEVSRRVDMIVALRAADQLDKDMKSHSAEAQMSIDQSSSPSHVDTKSFFGRYAFLLTAVAASVVLLPMLLFSLFRSDQTSFIQLAEEQFENRRLTRLQHAQRGDSSEPVLRFQNDSLIRHFQNLSTQNPANATILFTLGDLYFHNRQWDLAREAYTQGLDLEPQDEFSRWNRALTYLGTGNRDQAISMLEDFQSHSSPGFQTRIERLLGLIQSRSP